MSNNCSAPYLCARLLVCFDKASLNKFYSVVMSKHRKNVMSSNNEILKLLAMLKQQQTTASQGAYQNLVSQHPPANDNATQALLSKSRTNSNFTIPVNSTDILSQALNCQPTNSVVTHQQQQLLVLLNTLSSVNTKTATELAGYGCVQQPESSPQIQVCIDLFASQCFYMK